MRKTAITLLLLGSSVFAYWWTHRGHDSRHLSDLSRAFTLSVRAPWMGLEGGAMYVLVEGRLDGDAVVKVRSNYGRDYRELHLHPPAVAEILGGAEEWVRNASVEYQPGSAKAGDLYIAIYCGAGFSKEDWERFRRINAQRHG